MNDKPAGYPAINTYWQACTNVRHFDGGQVKVGSRITIVASEEGLIEGLLDEQLSWLEKSNNCLVYDSARYPDVLKRFQEDFVPFPFKKEEIQTEPAPKGYPRPGSRWELYGLVERGEHMQIFPGATGIVIESDRDEIQIQMEQPYAWLIKDEWDNIVYYNEYQTGDPMTWFTQEFRPLDPDAIMA